MKKSFYLLLITILVFRLSANGQSFMFNSSRSVAYVQQFSSDFAMWRDEVYCVKKDTLLNGRRYYYGLTNYGGNWSYEVNHKLHFESDLKKLDRNISKGSDSCLWYDFNLAVGDSFYFKDWQWLKLKSKVPRKCPDGRYRTYFYFQNNYHIWIDGIGEMREYNNVFGPRANVLLFADSAGIAYVDSSFYVHQHPSYPSLYKFADSILNHCNGNHLNPYTGLRAESEHKVILVSPNPVSGSLQMRVDLPGSQNFFCEIRDIYGRKMMEEYFHIGENNSIDVALWPPGVYLISVTSEDGRRFQKRVLKI